MRRAAAPHASSGRDRAACRQAQRPRLVAIGATNAADKRRLARISSASAGLELDEGVALGAAAATVSATQRRTSGSLTPASAAERLCDMHVGGEQDLATIEPGQRLGRAQREPGRGVANGRSRARDRLLARICRYVHIGDLRRPRGRSGRPSARAGGRQANTPTARPASGTEHAAQEQVANTGQVGGQGHMPRAASAGSGAAPPSRAVPAARSASAASRCAEAARRSVPPPAVRRPGRASWSCSR